MASLLYLRGALLLLSSAAAVLQHAQQVPADHDDRLLALVCRGGVDSLALFNLFAFAASMLAAVGGNTQSLVRIQNWVFVGALFPLGLAMAVIAANDRAAPCIGPHHATWSPLLAWLHRAQFVLVAGCVGFELLSDHRLSTLLTDVAVTLVSAVTAAVVYRSESANETDFSTAVFWAVYFGGLSFGLLQILSWGLWNYTSDANNTASVNGSISGKSPQRTASAATTRSALLHLSDLSDNDDAESTRTHASKRRTPATTSRSRGKQTTQRDIDDAEDKRIQRPALLFSSDDEDGAVRGRSAAAKTPKRAASPKRRGTDKKASKPSSTEQEPTSPVVARRRRQSVGPTPTHTATAESIAAAGRLRTRTPRQYAA